MIDLIAIALAAGATQAPAQAVVVAADMDAIEAYEHGFAYNVMRTPDDDAVMLEDMVLIESDGPGAGESEKGTWTEEICEGVLARKTFRLEDPSAFEAHLVLYMTPMSEDRDEQEPFFAVVNGRRVPGPELSWHEEMWHWVPVPVEALRAGENQVIVGCDAPRGQGYELMIARAGEYEGGGGAQRAGLNTALVSAGQLGREEAGARPQLEAIDVGAHSAKSVDGGETWVTGRLGTTDDVVGEYTIRLNLRRHKPRGALLSPPIDLWDGLDGQERIKPRCSVSDLKLLCLGDAPEGTSLTWQVRFADTADMTSEQWGAFRTVGSGEGLAAPVAHQGKRYLQWRAELTTSDPLKTPRVRGVKVVRRLTFTPPARRFYVWDYENVRHRYSSIRFHYEDPGHPRLRELRERLNLDEVIAGATGDWDRINRVRHHVSQLWHHDRPTPDYPEWDALEILDRRDRVGKGGMCIQFSIVFIQSLLSLGYQARHINVFAHETVEVYVDELGRWVHVDPESLFDSYQYHTATGMPVSCLEQHRYFLQESGLSAEDSIDWQATEPWARWGHEGTFVSAPVPLDFSTFTGWINDPDKPDYPPQHQLAGFMRMMPRNDYFSRPFPRPLCQGTTNWPWNGYLNWYDRATPRKLQYALHTDREADFYPTLNRVQFDAVHGEREGGILIRMFTFAPNFDGFEINVDGAGWRNSPAQFTWSTRPSALNTLEMRAKNRLGPPGKPSRLQVMVHHKEPFSPRPEDW